MFKYLRIAVTALCLTACVLLIGLWVRSYWWVTSIQTPPVASRALHCSFEPGRVRIESILLRTAEENAEWFSGLRHYHKSSPHYAVYNYPSPSFVLRYRKSLRSIRIIFPYWFAILIAGAASVAPWIRWRFSVRTLLIATTLVGVGLGIIVWLS
jgi:hypothetical protein